MKKLFLIICLVILLPQIAAAKQGEKQMANIIFEEDFTGGTTTDYYQNRGWYDGTGRIGTGYKFEHDQTLNKQVMYVHWSTPAAAGSDPNMPDGGATALRMALDPAQTEAGVTLHMAFKTHNMLETSGSRGQAGAHAFRFFQNIGRTGPSNSESQMNLIELGGLGREAGLNNPDGSKNWDPANASQTIYYMSGGQVSAQFAGPTGILRDDVWYEVRAYLKADPNAGGRNTKILMDYRVWGSPEWIRIMDKTGYPLTNMSGGINQFQIGPYTERWVNDIRLYAGFIKVYAGDAINDGTIGDGTPTEPPAPVEPPVTPPVEPPVSGEPVVSDFMVRTTATTANISWNTNVETNAVLDYGATEDRGIVERDDNMSKSHTFILTDLTESTNYYFRYSSKDANGNTAFDENNQMFATAAVEVPEVPVEDKFVIELDEAPTVGQGVMFDGDKWVAIDLRAEVKKILEEQVRLTVV